MMTLVRAASLALALAVTWVVWLIGGASALLYAGLFVLACLPGLPLGFALFGRRHAAGWIAGGLMGYATTALAWWAVVFARLPSTPAFAVAWAIAGATTWTVVRFLPIPAVSLPPWRRADTTALVLVLCLVPVLVGPPFARLGAKDSSGNRLYRAYFTADFVWHTALVAELTKHSQPPRNPYLASEPMHYYWTYFLVPATLVTITDIDVQEALKVNAVIAALLFLAAVYLAAWAAIPEFPFAVATAVFLTTVAPSAEGLWAIVDLLKRGRPLADLRQLNIDAVTAWFFRGLRIDDLPRAMWYNPQHSVACALGLVALPVVITQGVRASRGATALAGIALGASLVFNPFVGATFSAVYGIAVLIDAVRTRASIRAVARHALAAVPVLLAFGWCTLNQVAGDAVGALHFGLFGPARAAPFATLSLSFGLLLLPLVIGLWPTRDLPLTRAWPALTGVVLSLVLMFFVTLKVDLFWFGFRTGQIFFVMAPALVARGFVHLWRPPLKPVAMALGVLVLSLGLPTTIIDVYNAQDITNLSMGPGFHWTVTVTPAEQEGLAWIRLHTPRSAIVQAEPVIRGRETWSWIPSFAERRMAAGEAIPLIADTQAKSQQVRQIYAGVGAEPAWRLARDLHIDYLYVDDTERAAYPTTAKFDAHPEYFSPVFKNSEVSIYAVK